ncbi:MAG: aminodeoxychorismate/anthranilate synthase component II, partial [Vulcanococcus sp.]
MLLVLDNYDSFTFNLVQYLGELAADHPITEDLRVERNDALTLEQIREL